MKNDVITVSSRIAEHIEEYIAVKRLRTHDKLPSEREFCEMWNCNRMTLRAAIRKLINEGTLYNVHGSGTFVAERKIERNLWQFTSFSKAMENNGFKVSNRLISMRITEANKKISGNLHVPLGTEIIETKRLRLVDGKPVVIESSYIPYSLCRGIEEYDLQKLSLFEVLKQNYGVVPLRSSQEILITYTTNEESELLEVEPRTAVLLLKGVACNASDEPVEYSKAITRGDLCRFHSILK